MKLHRQGRGWRTFSAYTLAEVMVATLILGTMTVSLFAGFSAGFALVLMAREDERATQILNGKLEAVRFCRWSELTNLPVISFQTYYDPIANGNTNQGAVYLGTISTTNCDPAWGPVSYASNMRAVTIAVQWTNFFGGRPILRNRKVQTLVARYGMQNYLWGTSP